MAVTLGMGPAVIAMYDARTTMDRLIASASPEVQAAYRAEREATDHWIGFVERAV